MRRETEVHTGKQRRANTQIFSSTLHSEEGCFGITRPSGSASSGSDVREASCPVQKPATFHLQIHRKTRRTAFLLISFGRLENQNTFVRVNIQSDVEEKLVKTGKISSTVWKKSTGPVVQPSHQNEGWQCMFLQITYMFELYISYFKIKLGKDHSFDHKHNMKQNNVSLKLPFFWAAKLSRQHVKSFLSPLTSLQKYPAAILPS